MREVSITMPLPMAPEAYWALRMDRGFDEFCADLDRQIFHMEADNVSTDAQGLTCEAACRTQQLTCMSR